MDITGVVLTKLDGTAKGGIALAIAAELNMYERSNEKKKAIATSQQAHQEFQQFDSDSAAMIVLEGDELLGADAHHYYDDLVKKLAQDTTHVEHIQDFWGVAHGGQRV